MTNLNTDSPKPNFTVVPDAYCDECREGNLVYQCTCCFQTFCDGCTDLESWMNDHIKACPHCGHISPDQPGDNAYRRHFSESAEIQILVTANAATLEAARRQHGFVAELCYFSDKEGMTNLDTVAAEALEQFTVHLGIPYETKTNIKQAPITLRTALSDAALDSPSWEDHHKVSKWMLNSLNQQFGAELTQFINSN